MREYWVIDVDGRQVFVYRLGAVGTYGEALVFGADDVAAPVLMPELGLVLNKVVGI